MNGSEQSWVESSLGTEREIELKRGMDCTGHPRARRSGTEPLILKNELQRHKAAAIEEEWLRIQPPGRDKEKEND